MDDNSPSAKQSSQMQPNPSVDDSISVTGKDEHDVPSAAPSGADTSSSPHTEKKDSLDDRSQQPKQAKKVSSSSS